MNHSGKRKNLNNKILEQKIEAICLRKVFQKGILDIITIKGYCSSESADSEKKSAFYYNGILEIYLKKLEKGKFKAIRLVEIS